jgi:TAZ zinc finger
MESRKTTRTGGRDSRSRRNDETSAASSSPRVSVMEAVSTLDYQGCVAVESSPTTRESGSQEDLLSALGVQDSSVRVMVPVRSSSKRRDRSTSRTRRASAEERKQNIRENRARERSRSRSNTRSAQLGLPDISSHPSVAPSIMSRESSVTTEKTRTSRRPTSSKADTKRSNTQQLILLRHAARCPYGPDSLDKETRGKCPIHKQCAETKELLGHMAMCHVMAGGCPFPGCDGSKGLFSVVYPSGAPKASLDTSRAPEPPASPMVAAPRRPKNQETTSLLATPPTQRSEGSYRKAKDPLDRTTRDEQFRPDA